MERAPQIDPTQLTGIHLNLEAQAIEFEDRHGTVGRLRFTGETVLYEGRPLLLLPNGQSGSPEEAQALSGPDQPPAPNTIPRPSQNSTPQHPRTEF